MITKRPLLVLLAALTAIIIITFPRVGTTSQLSITENRTALSGGELATVFKKTQTAFAQPITNLDRDRRRVFNFGDHLFNTKWVEAPSSVATLDGLGPLFNRSSCAGCHIRDGRGRPPLPHEKLILFISKQSSDNHSTKIISPPKVELQLETNSNIIDIKLSSITMSAVAQHTKNNL